MNKGFYSLLKIQFNSVLRSLFGTTRSKKKANNYLPILLPIFLGLYISFVMCMSFGQVLGVSEYYILYTIIAIVISMIVLTFTIYQIGGHLFQCKDYDLLYTLPIPHWQILASKILSFYLYQYIYFFVALLVPSYYFVSAGGSLLVVVGIYLLSIFLPAFPIFIGSLLSLIVMYISSFFKNKSFIMIALYVAVVAFFLVLPNMINVNSNTQLISLEEMFKAFSIYPFAYYLGLVIKNHSIVDVLIYLIINNLPLFLFVGIFAKSFNKINTKLNRKTTSKKAISVSSYSEANLSKALLKTEISRYFQIPFYVLNTIIGPLLMIVLMVATIFLNKEAILLVLEVPELGSMLYLMVILAGCFLVMISPTTAASISIEGRNIYMLKTLPIRAYDIFFTKIKLCLLLNLPISLVAISVICIVLSVPIPSTIISVIMVGIACIYAAYVGLIVNLHFPRFDWINVTVVVKQSASVLITMLVNIISVAIAAFGTSFFSRYVPINVCLIVIEIIAVIMIVGFHTYLKKIGEKKLVSFNK